MLLRQVHSETGSHENIMVSQISTAAAYQQFEPQLLSVDTTKVRHYHYFM